MVFFGETEHSRPVLSRIITWGGQFFTDVKQQCRENMVLIMLCLVAYIAMYLSKTAVDIPNQTAFMAYIKRALLSISPMILFGFVLWRLVRLCFVEKPDIIVLALARDIKEALTDTQRYARMVPMLLAGTIGFIAFLNFKVLIPKLIPFYADEVFVEIERALHFGRLPTDWLSPLLAMPRVIESFDFLYKLWYFVMFGMWGWAAWGASDNGWRRQFILAFMLCWIFGGTVLATLLSSVGPCFYGAFVAGENPYASYMMALQAIHESDHLIALNIQTLMANVYFNDTYTDNIGISAMPSLHNTLAVLFAITGYKIHRKLGHILTLYAVIIFLGSVILAWHYAIDGYVGLILAFAMWKLAAVLLSLQDRVMGQPENTQTI